MYITHPIVYLWLLFIILDLHKLIQRVHIYIFYILVHTAQAVPTMMLIYTLSYFINKVYQNNDNNNKNNNDDNKIIIDFLKMHNSTNVYVQSQFSLR